MSADLTEKLKELLMGCENLEGGYYCSGKDADLLAKQLAPEIEKMMPRWIPVSERLPEDGQRVDVQTKDDRRFTDVFINKTTYKGWRWDNHDYSVQFDSVIYWMPIPKGPTE